MFRKNIISRFIAQLNINPLISFLIITPIKPLLPDIKAGPINYNFLLRGQICCAPFKSGDGGFVFCASYGII